MEEGRGGESGGMKGRRGSKGVGRREKRGEGRRTAREEGIIKE